MTETAEKLIQLALVGDVEVEVSVDILQQPHQLFSDVRLCSLALNPSYAY